MPSCSIKNCRGKNRNVPNWTLHKLPTNEKRKNQWLDIIGEENINFKMKYIKICSIHFDESSFNRTLNITKLHDDAVPSRALIQTQIRANSLDEQSLDDVEDRKISMISDDAQKIEITHMGSIPRISKSQIMSRRNLEEQTKKYIRICKLKNKCEFQSKQVKALQKMVGRQRTKTTNFVGLVHEIKEKAVKNNTDHTYS